MATAFLQQAPRLTTAKDFTNRRSPVNKELFPKMRRRVNYVWMAPVLLPVLLN